MSTAGKIATAILFCISFGTLALVLQALETGRLIAAP